RLYAEDVEGALRAANRAGDNAQAIAKARIAVIGKAPNAKALLDAAPAEASRDVGYVFSRVQFLRRAEQPAEAAEWILSVTSDHAGARGLVARTRGRSAGAQGGGACLL